MTRPDHRHSGAGRHRITVGADRAYDTAGFVAGLRRLNATPHVAQNLSGRARASTVGPYATPVTRGEPTGAQADRGGVRLAAARKVQERFDIPAIAATGNLAAAEAEAAGLLGILSKPYTTQALRAVLEGGGSMAGEPLEQTLPEALRLTGRIRTRVSEKAPAASQASILLPDVRANVVWGGRASRQQPVPHCTRA